MADTVPSSSDRIIEAHNAQISRLWKLTLFSLVLNALILALLVVGAIIHHHMEKREFSRGGMAGGPWKHHMGWGDGGGFHRFGGMGPQCPGFNGGRGEAEDEDDRGGGPGMATGGPRNFGGGSGDLQYATFGWTRMNKMPGGSPPDPAKMTDGILMMLSGKLALTDDEKAKIKPVLQDQVVQFQKQMEAQRAVMQKQIEDAKAKLKPLLTPDQQKQLDALPMPGTPKPPDAPKPEAGENPGQ